MANHKIKNPQQFTDELRILETTDRNHADNFNPLFEALINNDAFLKKIADMAAEHMKATASHVPTNKGAAPGSYLKSDGTWAVPPDTNTTYGNMRGASASAAGGAGLVPAPAQGAANRYLRSDGTWQVPPDTNTTYSAATQSAAGLLSAGDKKKLDGVAANANNYTHPTSHPASMITQDATHRFVTDTEKAGWTGKADANHSHNNYAASNHTHNYAASNHSHAYSTITGRPTGLDSGYVRTGQISGKVIGSFATAEGTDNEASGNWSHVEGSSNKATGEDSHVEGAGNTASSRAAHAEGSGCTASGGNAHAEGAFCIASGSQSHAEGNSSTASGAESHAGGYNCTASGNHSCAHGNTCQALATDSHVFGYKCTAEAGATLGAFAAGSNTIVQAQGQTAIGAYNVAYNTGTGAIFIIGNGASSARSNAFRVTYNGTAYGKAAYQTSGADYAEYFEWLDKNPEKEDRRGYFVTLDGNKVRKATAKDTYILGVVSAKPVVVGNSDPDDWHGHFLTDIFGNFLTEWREAEFPVFEDVEEEETYIDEEGNEATRIVHRTVEKTEKRMVEAYIVNPDYDPEQPYTPRAERPEWSPIGMLGQLIVRDDGTCKVNGYCAVADGGTATEAESGYRVIERVADNLVKIIFR